MNKLFPSNSLIDETSSVTKKRSFFRIALVFLIVYMIGSFVSSIVVSIPMFTVVLNDPEMIEIANSQLSVEEYSAKVTEILTRVTSNLPDWLNALSLYSTIATIAVTIFYCCKTERRRLFTLGFGLKGAVWEYLSGLGIGLVLFSSAYGISLLSGEISFGGFNPEVSIGTILMFFFGFIIQGASEEILIRGYLFVSSAANTSVMSSIFISSGVFAILHLGNPGISYLAIVNLFLFGVFAAIYFLRRGSIWGICAIHSIWNFAQGNIFGCEVSGLELNTSIFTTVENGKTIWSGGNFGPEGGLGVTVVLVIAITIVTFMKNKNQNGFYAIKTSESKSMFF